ncbi:MAG: hypothetical protein IJU23_00215 [Proteobacteria bacterium]|nr:hypothetical protein [Pseudomonadota bacterium]
MPGYLIKTANFVAEISNDDELTHLAQVDTIQKDTMVCQLPGKTWIEAKKLPILRKVWGLDASASVPPPIQNPVESDVPAIKSKLPPSLKTVVAQNPYFVNNPEQEDETTVRPAPTSSECMLESGIQDLTSSDIAIFESFDEDTTGVMPHGSHELGATELAEDNISCDIPAAEETQHASEEMPAAPDSDMPAAPESPATSETESDSSAKSDHEDGTDSKSSALFERMKKLSDEGIPEAAPIEATYVIESSRVENMPTPPSPSDASEPMNVEISSPSSDAPVALDDDVQPFISVPEHSDDDSSDDHRSLSQDYILLGLIDKKAETGHKFAVTETVPAIEPRYEAGLPKATLIGISAIPPLGDNNKNMTGIPAFKSSASSSDPLTIKPFEPGMKADMPAIAEPAFLAAKSGKDLIDRNDEVPFSPAGSQMDIFDSSVLTSGPDELSVIADCRELLGKLDEAERKSASEKAQDEHKSIVFPVREMPGESDILNTQQGTESSNTDDVSDAGDSPATNIDNPESHAKPLEATGKTPIPEPDESNPPVDGRDDEENKDIQRDSAVQTAIKDADAENTSDASQDIIADAETAASHETQHASVRTLDETYVIQTSPSEMSNSDDITRSNFAQADETPGKDVLPAEDTAHTTELDTAGSESTSDFVKFSSPETPASPSLPETPSNPPYTASRIDPDVSAEMLETIEYYREEPKRDVVAQDTNKARHSGNPLLLEPLADPSHPETEDMSFAIAHEEKTNQLPAMDDPDFDKHGTGSGHISDNRSDSLASDIQGPESQSDEDQSSQTRNRVRSRRISHRHNSRCPSANVRELQRFRELPEFSGNTPDVTVTLAQDAAPSGRPTLSGISSVSSNFSPAAANILQNLVKQPAAVIEGRLPANENDMTVSMEPFYATHAAENDQTISMEACGEIKQNIPSEFKTARDAVEAAIRAASKNGHIDGELLKSAVSFVDALDNNKPGNKSDAADDDSPSDIVKVRDRRALKLEKEDEEGSTITHRYQNKIEEEYPIPDDDISSDHVTVRGRSELRHLLAADEKSAETDSIPSLQPLSTEDYCRKNGGEIRKLFQEHDELHLILENDVREKELEVEKEQAQDSSSSLSAKKGVSVHEDSIMASMPVRNSSIVAAPLKKADPEPTKITSATYREPSDNKDVQVANKFVEEKLYQDEVQLTEFNNLYLTSKRLFAIDVKNNAVTNYEAFDIDSIQSFGIHEEQRIYFIVIALILCLACGVLTAIRMDPVSIGCLVFSVLLLPLSCLLAFRKVMIFNCSNGRVIKSRCAISESNRQSAMEFLNQFDAARVECRSELRKGSRK